MKRIEAVIRPAKVGDVCCALEKIDCPGLMISEIEGHGKQKGLEQQLRGKTYRVDLLTKARVEIIANDEDAERIVDTIQHVACTGKMGDGKIFIYPVDDVVRIRTAEKGEIAV